MKKILSIVALILMSLLVTPVAHAGVTVELTDAPHRQIDGKFLDDSLAAKLLPSGRLGAPIYKYRGSISTLYIDPSLVEDVQAMAKGYTLVNGTAGTGEIVAKTWLSQLLRVTNGAHMYAIPYGNPSEYWITKFAPHDRDYFLSLSSSRLSTLLGRFTYPTSAYYSTKYFTLRTEHLRLMQRVENQINVSAGYMDSADLEQFKLNSVKIFNASLTATSRTQLAYDLAGKIQEISNSVHTSTGKFTITANHQKLPVTLINDFPQPVKVKLLIRSINERITVNDQNSIDVAAKSKVQILIPVEVYTSGDSGFTIAILDSRGHALGEKTLYPVKVSVVSPIATWITGAAGLTLLVAAILQSLRSIRKGKP